MPGKHSAREKRRAKHIAESERASGKSPEESEHIAWATVNKMRKGPFDDYAAVPQRGEWSGRTTHVQEVKVPDVLKPPRTQSEAPRTVGTFDRQSKAPITLQHEDRRPADPRTIPGAHTKFSDAGDIRPKQSTPAPLAPRVVAPTAPTVSPGPASQRNLTAAAEQRASQESRGAPYSRGPDPHSEKMARDKFKLRAPPQAPAPKPPVVAQKSVKSFQLMSLNDYYDAITKAASAPPAPAPATQGSGPPKKFPSRDKTPNVLGKPVKKALMAVPREPKSAAAMRATAMANVSDTLESHIKAKELHERAAEFRGESASERHAAQFHEGHVVYHAGRITELKSTKKALATGYGKVSGGGALKAPNRGFPSKKALRLSVNDLNRATPDPSRPTTSSTKSPRPLDGGGAALMGSMPPPTLMKPNNVVQKPKGTSMSKTNFNDLFKSELGIPNDEVLCECPHCDAPITKSDLVAKAGDDMVVNQNKKGGMTRSGDGRGQITPSRPGGAAKQTDEVVGVQNSKGSKARKSDVESEDGMDKGEAQAAPSPRVATKSLPIIRGTEWVQYVDDGSDASIAKSIAEGAIGQQPTQPMDLNNDLSRLLV